MGMWKGERVIEVARGDLRCILAMKIWCKNTGCLDTKIDWVFVISVRYNFG